MSQCEISEFSFGYALTEAITQNGIMPIEAAPYFPSLREEGELGYDLRVKAKGFSIYLQFKVPYQIQTRRGRFSEDIVPPYFQFYTRNNSFSDQHNILCRLERKRRCVYYAAPIFSSSEKLNQFYRIKQIPRNTLFLQPSAIGELQAGKAALIGYDESGKSIVEIDGKQSYVNPVHVNSGDDLFTHCLNLKKAKSPSHLIKGFPNSLDAMLDIYRSRVLIQSPNQEVDINEAIGDLFGKIHENVQLKEVYQAYLYLKYELGLNVFVQD